MEPLDDQFVSLIYVKDVKKMNQQIYLDNAATTKIADAVKAEMEPYLREN